jgi:hypothetical protein
MIRAVQTGNREDLRAAQGDLRNSGIGLQFQQEGNTALDRQNAERIEPKQQVPPPPQIEPEPACGRH